ncbi:hypothetical protein ACFE04_030565 [Oxalis oulophora]
MSPPKSSGKKSKKSTPSGDPSQPQPSRQQNLGQYRNTDIIISKDMNVGVYRKFLGEFRDSLRGTEETIQGHFFTKLRRFSVLKREPWELFVTTRVIFQNDENIEKTIIFVFANWNSYLVGLIFSNIVLRIGEDSLTSFELCRIEPLKGNSTNWIEIRDLEPKFLTDPSYQSLTDEAKVVRENLTFGMELVARAIDDVYKNLNDFQNSQLTKKGKISLAVLVLQGVLFVSEPSRFSCLEEIFCHNFKFNKINPVQGLLFNLLQNWSKLCKCLLTNKWTPPLITYPRIITENQYDEEEDLPDRFENVQIISIEVVKGVIVTVLDSGNV